ncbi:hypothetical protein EV589_3494 [Mycobacterium sp. BK558]|nr:hypothetical protein EV589_3494 [Mycobacterium sp. BK558]
MNEEHRTQLEGVDRSAYASLLERADQQLQSLRAIDGSAELSLCLLDKLGRIVCMSANEHHRQSGQLATIAATLSRLLEMYRSVHPEQALHHDKFAALQAEVHRCCPPEDTTTAICHYEPCKPHHGVVVGDGYSMKSRARVDPVKVSDRPHEPWKRNDEELNEHQMLPTVHQGPLVGPIAPSTVTPSPMDFRSGTGTLGTQQPVTFRTFTSSGITTGVWPPDSSGAKGGDVVVMSGNLWLKLSVDGGKTFTDLDFTKVFTAEKTYGGWAGDQVIHYVPSIDCFVLYVQSSPGSGSNASKSVVKVALASPDDLRKFKGGKQAWRRQWDFTSDTFGMNLWMDFPDLSYGDGYLYVNTNTFSRLVDSSGNVVLDSSGNPQDTFGGRLFFELPLKEMAEGAGFSFYYALCTDNYVYSSPTQNVADENYWAAHVDNSTMRIYSSKGSDPNYYWRERRLGANWPRATKDNVVSAAPDSADWISEDHRIIGATKVGNLLWFAWTAASGSGGAGGFSFPQPHIQIAKFDISQDYKFIEQTQVWNANNAYAYPSLTTNSDYEVGISLAWGGGTTYGSHAVGILGDFVVWYGDASERTSQLTSPTRFGDYVHVRLAHPDTRFFSAFGYAVKKDSTAAPPEKADYLYVEFGREAIPASPLH